MHRKIADFEPAYLTQPSYIRTNFFTRLLLLFMTDRPLRKSDETSFLTPLYDIWRETGKKRARIIKVLQQVAMRSGRKVLRAFSDNFFAFPAITFA